MLGMTDEERERLAAFKIKIDARMVDWPPAMKDLHFALRRGLWVVAPQIARNDETVSEDDARYHHVAFCLVDGLDIYGITINQSPFSPLNTSAFARSLDILPDGTKVTAGDA